jgi:L-aspartate oxidase
MVFAARAVEAVADGKEGAEPTGAMRALDRASTLAVPVAADRSLQAGPPRGVAKAREALQLAMSAGAGVLRDAASLAEARAVAAEVMERPTLLRGEGMELANLAQVATALVVAAGARQESRGCHTRRDFPETSEAFARRLVIGG